MENISIQDANFFLRYDILDVKLRESVFEK